MNPFNLFEGITGLAVVLIVLATFNYTSLAVARSLLRAREVGVRKTLGCVLEGIRHCLQRQDISRIKDVYSRLPEISYIAMTSHMPGEGNIWSVQIRVNEEDEKAGGHYFLWMNNIFRPYLLTPESLLSGTYNNATSTRLEVFHIMLFYNNLSSTRTGSTS